MYGLFSQATAARFHALVTKRRCWEWRGPRGSSGYGSFSHHGRTYPAHRYAWRLAHNGRVIPSRRMVIHSCDRKLCVNPKHLSLGTAQRNVREMMARGLHTRCKRVFTAKEAKQIAKLLHDGERHARLARKLSSVALAKRYGVTRNVLRRIKHGHYRSYDRELRRN